MDPTLDRLVKLVPPPAHPFDAGDDEHWRSVEAVLGLKLPADFQQLTRVYGTGYWQKFWYLLNPITSNFPLNLIAQSQSLRPTAWSTLDAERLFREEVGLRYPHAIYPERSGLLPWAITDNGGRFFWLTEGESAAWPTVYYPDRAPEHHVYNVSCAELLYGAVSGTVPVFSKEFGPAYEYGRPDSFIPTRY